MRQDFHLQDVYGKGIEEFMGYQHGVFTRTKRDVIDGVVPEEFPSSLLGRRM